MRGRGRLTLPYVILALLMDPFGALASDHVLAGSGQTRVDDEELKRLLRPSDGVREDSLVRDDEVVTYAATLMARPGRDFGDRYVQELAERGLWMDPSTSSAYRPMGGVQGYVFKVLQEVRVAPYTVRYSVAYEGAGRATLMDWPFPIQIRGKRLTFKLGAGLLNPWRTQIVVPETSPVALPFPVPLPPRSVVVRVDDDRTTRKDDPQPRVLIAFLSTSPPSDTIAFFRRELGSTQAVWRDGVGKLGVTLASPLPTWAPLGLTDVLVTEQPYLFTDPVGISVPVAAYASGKKTDVEDARHLRSLQHIPRDMFSYWLICYLDLSGPAPRPGAAPGVRPTFPPP